MSVIAAHDRKLDRTFLQTLLFEVCNLNEYIRRAELLEQVIFDLQKGELTVERCQIAMAQHLKEAEARRVIVHRQMFLMAEMPWANDIIN